MRRIAPVLSLAALTAALAAPPAFAGDFYVTPGGSGNACTEAQPCSTVMAAVNAASDDDTIHIAAGTYTAGADTNKRLSFVGAGNDTFIDIPGNGATPALQHRNSGSVTALRLRGQAQPGSMPAGGHGLSIYPEVGGSPVTVTVTDVDSTGGANIVTGSGISVRGSAAPLRPIKVTVRGGRLSSSPTAQTALDVDADRATVDIAGTMLDRAAIIRSAALTRITDVTSSAALFAQRGRVEVDRSRFLATFSAALGVGPSDGGVRVTARNSVFASTTTAPFQPASPNSAVSVVGGTDPGEDANVTLIGSTVYATGPGWHAALGASRFQDRPGSADVKLVNTVLERDGADGVNTFDLLAATGAGDGGVVDVTAHHSAFGPVKVAGQAIAPATGSATNLSADPKFAAAPSGTLDGADFALQADSPLIDAGDGSVPVADEKDAAGAARVQDGNGSCTATPDIGAFERAAAPCTSTPPLIPLVTPLAVDKTKPVVSKLKVSGGKASLTLSEAAKLTVTVERVKKGRKSGSRCLAGRTKGKTCTLYTRVRKLTPTGKLGANSVALGKLGAASYRVRITATDAAGNVATEVSARFTVKTKQKKR